MHRVLTTLVLAGAATLAACANSGDEGMLVTKNVVPQAGCLFTGDTAEPFFSEGQWSILSPGGYLFHPQVQSRVTALAGEEQERTIITTGANIDINIIDPDLAGSFDSSLTHFQEPMSIPLAPIEGGVGTVADGEFVMIPHAFIDQLLVAKPELAGANPPPFSTQVVVTFSIVGTMSGQDVDSQPFTYGVTIGNNVVVDDLGPCPISGTGLPVPNACNIFQDGVVGCCEASGGLVCPAQTK